ncbi:MAG: hypothetical protein CMO55_26350 [Verrucomicrobiales bacterium]|nr:hypothetical protein [Verrucomicrobiales bacterium]
MKHVALPLALLLSFTIGFSADEQTESKKKKKPDFTEVDASEFSQKLDAASTEGEKWANAPETIIVEYVGPFITESGEKMGQRRSIGIRTKGEGVPKRLRVTLTDDGLFDDETKKITTRLYLKRGKKDGAWKLLKVERAMEKWAPPA